MGNYEIIFQNGKGQVLSVVVEARHIAEAVDKGEWKARLEYNISDYEIVCCKKTTFRG